MSNGWEESAAAWIADQAETGDFGRRWVMDAPMMARAGMRPYRRALDVGCGEGRFCRMLQQLGVETVGVDPTQTLIERARERDPGGDYRIEAAEALGFEDGSFDLVVSYLTLIDIPDVATAVQEMARVLAPGGTLLIANLNGYTSAGDEEGLGWTTLPNGARAYAIDRYLDERSILGRMARHPHPKLASAVVDLHGAVAEAGSGPDPFRRTGRARRRPRDRRPL